MFVKGCLFFFKPQKSSVVGMVPNWIWRRSSSSDGVYNTFSLLLLPDSLRPGAVVSISFPSMGQIDMFKNY